MKRWLPAILLVCVAVAVSWFLASRSKTRAPSADIPDNSNTTVAAPHNSKAAATAPERQESGPTPGKSIANSSPGATAPGAPAKPLPYIVGSADSPPTNIEPQIVLENMRRAVINYGSTF